ncbi:MAG: hypothetical protein IJ836_08470 [Spirochaetales bacterium]|nr:hypothetical protein [Spirochaetales bacterium]
MLPLRVEYEAYIEQMARFCFKESILRGSKDYGTSLFYAGSCIKVYYLDNIIECA